MVLNDTSYDHVDQTDSRPGLQITFLMICLHYISIEILIRDLLCSTACLSICLCVCVGMSMLPALSLPTRPPRWVWCKVSIAMVLLEHSDTLGIIPMISLPCRSMRLVVDIPRQLLLLLGRWERSLLYTCGNQMPTRVWSLSRV